MGNTQQTQKYKISGLVIVDVLKLYRHDSLQNIRNEQQIIKLIQETFKLLLKNNLEIDEQTEPLVHIQITRSPSDNVLDTPYLYQFDINLTLMVQSAFFSVNSPQLFCKDAQKNVQKYQIKDFFDEHGEVLLMVNFWEQCHAHKNTINSMKSPRNKDLDDIPEAEEEKMNELENSPKKAIRQIPQKILSYTSDNNNNIIAQQTSTNQNNQVLDEQIESFGHPYYYKQGFKASKGILDDNLQKQSSNNSKKPLKKMISLSNLDTYVSQFQQINDTTSINSDEMQSTQSQQQTYNHNLNQSTDQGRKHGSVIHTRQGKKRKSVSFTNNINEFNSDNENNSSQELCDSLEITETYFLQNFKKLTNIQEGGFGDVALYYDCNLHKLLAVKHLKQPEKCLQESLDLEHDRILTAIRGTGLQSSERFQDQKIRGLRRNIVREIKLTYVSDKASSYHKINKLEGVVYLKSNKTFLLVFEFFGNLLFQENRLHCDLLDFMYENKQNKQMFKNMKDEQKINIIRSSFTQLLKAVRFLHKQKDMVIRDLKDTNVLMKRKFNKDVLNESIYDIQLIDFGMSKGLTTYTEDDHSITETESDMDFQLQRTSSIRIQVSHQGRHPKFLFNQKYLYEKKDDVFALGSLLYRLFQLFSLAKYIGPDIKELIVEMTQIDYKEFQAFFFYIDQDNFAKAKSIFNEKQLIERQKNAPSIGDVIKKWTKINHSPNTQFLIEKKNKKEQPIQKLSTEIKK